MTDWTAEEIVAKALFELQRMKERSCMDYGLLQHILEGKV